MTARTILVTGGAGFIGSNFVRLAIARTARVVVLDKLTYAGNLGNLRVVSKDPRYRFVPATSRPGGRGGGLRAQARPPS